MVNSTKNIRSCRLVWYQYQCGSRMHKDHGFAFDDGCTVTALRQCLVKVSRMRTMAKARLAVRNILKSTASSFHPNRKYCLPLYDETNVT